MIKALLEFGLTRSAIVVLGLLVFCAAGLVAFTKLNIEAYPNPAPVILEITAQAPGLSAEEMEKYGKADEANQLKSEIKIVESYLPKKASPEETTKLVDEFLNGLSRKRKRSQK